MTNRWSCAALIGALLMGFGVPALAADVEVDVRLPGISIHIGDRDRDGRYWDGEHWQAPDWWRDNCHRFRDHKDFRGNCDAPPRAPRHCPPGQAKKGNC